MLKKLSDTIYYLANQNEKERPTLGLVCGDHSSLIIDAGNSPQHAKDFLQDIAKLNVPPVKYVVITHAHWDHFLGMNEFDASIIVNNQTKVMLEKWRNYSFDDYSLQQYVNNREIDALCMEIIQSEMPNRERFKLNSPTIIFENSITIDLGNKVCIIEQIKSTHTDDSTIIYIPDEKVIFLGDAAYGTTKNALYHFKQSLLLPMIDDIEKYNAELYLLGHESLCDKNEMKLYWEELTTTCSVVKSKSLQDAIKCFKVETNREPNDNELFFMQAFVNDQIIRSQKR